MTTIMTNTESMLIQWQCQQLINRVTNLVDQRRWQELALCYTEDATLFRPSDADIGIEGRAAILQSFTQRPPKTTCHLIANTEFRLESERSVVAESRVWLISGPVGETLPVSAEQKIMVGSFIDSMVLVDSQWLIKKRQGSIELKLNCG